MALDTGYQVIARRWRPRQFDELVGQDHIVRTLRNAITQQRIAHAYLFVGPRGTGKTSMARVFAKALNCENGPAATPPDDSAIGKAIMNGNCMDVIEIDGASNNSVDQIRDLRQDCQYAPAQCRYKIYIIDEVHMLSASAFNALLKTLEEPPSHVKFIFATTESQKVIPTIVSRCQRFEFRPIPVNLIVAKLEEIAEGEKIKVEKEAFSAIARLAHGGMRDAQSILDQMISFSGDRITEKEVLDVYGLVAADRIEALAKAIAAAQPRVLITLVEELALEGRDLYRVLLDLEDFIRKILLRTIRKKGKDETLGHPLGMESLLRVLDVLHTGETFVKTGLSEKVNFEITLLKAIEASRARAIDSLLRELSEIAAASSEEAVKKKIAEPLEAPAGGPGAEQTSSPEVGLKPASPVERKVDETGSEEGEEAEKASSGAGEGKVLPRLSDLVARVPESNRKLLEDRFRGKFREVWRIDPKALF